MSVTVVSPEIPKIFVEIREIKLLANLGLFCEDKGDNFRFYSPLSLEKVKARTLTLNGNNLNVESILQTVAKKAKLDISICELNVWNRMGKIMKAWDVYLDGDLIDTVFYAENCDAEYVYNGLVNHDGYNPNIKVFSKDKTVITELDAE